MAGGGESPLVQRKYLLVILKDEIQILESGSQKLRLLLAHFERLHRVDIANSAEAAPKCATPVVDRLGHLPGVVLVFWVTR